MVSDTNPTRVDEGGVLSAFRTSPIAAAKTDQFKLGNALGKEITSPNYATEQEIYSLCWKRYNI
jgi:hypothetical protein